MERVKQTRKVFQRKTDVPRGWSGGAMVLGKLLVPGRPTNLDYSRARAFCACRRCGWGVVWTFFLSSIISLLSPSLWETARYRLKYCLKGPLNPIQPTNQPDFPHIPTHLFHCSNIFSVDILF